MVDRDYEDLTQKQKEIIDAYISLYREQGEPTPTQVSSRVDSTASYCHKVLDQYEELAEKRRSTAMTVVADGEGHFDLRLSETDTWRAIKLLPDELSKKIFEQVKAQE